MNGLNVSRETFAGLFGERDRSLVLFDLIKGTYDRACTLEGKVDQKNETQDMEIKALGEKFSKRKAFDTGISAITGLIGGIGVVLGKVLFFK